MADERKLNGSPSINKEYYYYYYYYYASRHCVGLPSKHKTFVQHLRNVGPTSSTLARHCTNVIQIFCVCWVHIRQLVLVDTDVLK